ncbi:MAG: type IV pilus secretin PilQ, partial [Pseudomonadota bacterium]
GPSARLTVGGSLGPTAQTVTSQTGQQLVSGTPDITLTPNVNLPAAGVGGLPAAAFSTILFNKNFTQFITMELTALEADGKGKIISSPRVLTGDKIEALIEQGTEIPYQSATLAGANQTSFRRASLILKVKPQITPDGNVIMTLDIIKDSIGQVTAQGLAIDTKHVKTEVLVENGGTVVIGGIFLQSETNTITKVPMFGDLPVLGNLFRNNAKVDNKTELLVFITPRIVDDRLTVR